MMSFTSVLPMPLALWVTQTSQSVALPDVNASKIMLTCTGGQVWFVLSKSSATKATTQSGSQLAAGSSMVLSLSDFTDIAAICYAVLGSSLSIDLGN